MPVHIYASRSSPPQFPPPNQPFFPARFHAPPPPQVRISPGPYPLLPRFPSPIPPSKPFLFLFCACLSRRRPGRAIARPEKHTPPQDSAAGNSRRRHAPPAGSDRCRRSMPRPANRQAGIPARPANRPGGRSPPLLPPGETVPPKKRAADRRHRTGRHHSARRLMTAAGSGGGTQCLQKEAPYTVPPIGGTTYRAAQSGGKQRTPIGVPKNRPPRLRRRRSAAPECRRPIGRR